MSRDVTEACIVGPDGFSLSGYTFHYCFEGGMGYVLKAWNASEDAYSAIKLLKPCYNGDSVYVERFHREIEVLGRLNHPGIVRLLSNHCTEKPDHKEWHYFEMSWLEGGTLGDVLEAYRQRGDRMPIESIISILRPLCGALHHAHTYPAEPVVHRDLKPSNIVLLGDDPSRPILTDFGIVHVQSDRKLTQQFNWVGAAEYMSPEHASKSGVGPRSDLYSLGIVLYEMTTGEVPFPDRDGNPLAVLASHIQQRPTSPKVFRPDLPDWLEHVIMGLLRKRPEDRFSSAAEVSEMIGSHTPVGDGDLRTIGLPTGQFRDEDLRLALREQRDRLTTAKLVPQKHAPRALLAAAIVLLALVIAAAGSLIWWQMGQKNDFVSHMNSARQLHYRGEPLEAWAHIDAALRIAPSNPEAQQLRRKTLSAVAEALLAQAREQYRQNRYSSAIRVLDRLLEKVDRDNQNAKDLKTRAQTCHQLREVDDLFDTRDYAKAMEHLGSISARIDNYEDIRELLKEYKPEWAASLVNHIGKQAGEKRYDDAFKTLVWLRELDPDVEISPELLASFEDVRKERVIQAEKVLAEGLVRAVKQATTIDGYRMALKAINGAAEGKSSIVNLEIKKGLASTHGLLSESLTKIQRAIWDKDQGNYNGALEMIKGTPRLALASEIRKEILQDWLPRIKKTVESLVQHRKFAEARNELNKADKYFENVTQITELREFIYRIEGESSRLAVATRHYNEGEYGIAVRKLSEPFSVEEFAKEAEALKEKLDEQGEMARVGKLLQAEKASGIEIVQAVKRAKTVLRYKMALKIIDDAVDGRSSITNEDIKKSLASERQSLRESLSRVEGALEKKGQGHYGEALELMKDLPSFALVSEVRNEILRVWLSEVGQRVEPLVKQGKFTDARSELNKAKKFFENENKIHELSGLISKAEGESNRLSEAARHVKAAEYEIALEMLSTPFFSADFAKEAGVLKKKLIALVKPKVSEHLKEGKKLEEQERYDEAQAVFLRGKELAEQFSLVELARKAKVHIAAVKKRLSPGGLSWSKIIREDVRCKGSNGKALTKQIVYYYNSQGMKFAYIKPSGKLRGFFISATEVTQSQFRSVFRGYRVQRATMPAGGISWKVASDFCRKLGMIRNASGKVGGKFTLPTESQWEYACRGGATTPYAFGATLDGNSACFSTNAAAADGPKAVASYSANVYGIYDMHGNLWEWCRDKKGVLERAMRGGCYRNRENKLTCSFAERSSSRDDSKWNGLRIVVELEPEL